MKKQEFKIHKPRCAKIPPMKVVIDKPTKAARRANVKRETRRAIMDF